MVPPFIILVPPWTDTMLAKYGRTSGGRAHFWRRRFRVPEIIQPKFAPPPFGSWSMETCSFFMKEISRPLSHAARFARGSLPPASSLPYHPQGGSVDFAAQLPCVHHSYNHASAE